jgi:uncharacterized protein YqgC (DUF456 family)
VLLAESIASSPIVAGRCAPKNPNQECYLSVTLIIIGLILAIAGIVGCILPILPGPALSFCALILLAWIKNWQIFSQSFLIVMGVITALLILLDYVAPALGAKKYGASKRGIWGSAIGMIIGIFFIPPWGMIVGAFIGALVGELSSGKSGRNALRAGWGILIGNVFVVGLKLAFTAVVLFYYLKEMF